MPRTSKSRGKTPFSMRSSNKTSFKEMGSSSPTRFWEGQETRDGVDLNPSSSLTKEQRATRARNKKNIVSQQVFQHSPTGGWSPPVIPTANQLELDNPELDNPELESSVNTEEENALGSGDAYNVRENRSGYEFGY